MVICYSFMMSCCKLQVPMNFIKEYLLRKSPNIFRDATEKWHICSINVDFAIFYLTICMLYLPLRLFLTCAHSYHEYYGGGDLQIHIIPNIRNCIHYGGWCRCKWNVPKQRKLLEKISRFRPSEFQNRILSIETVENIPLSCSDYRHLPTINLINHLRKCLYICCRTNIFEYEFEYVSIKFILLQNSFDDWRSLLRNHDLTPNISLTIYVMITN